MTTLTLHIADQSVMPLLLDAIKGLKGVTIAQKPACTHKAPAKAKPAEKTLSDSTQKIDGEQWAREVLLPIVQEVREATAKGYRYPDAHELFAELEKDEV